MAIKNNPSSQYSSLSLRIGENTANRSCGFDISDFGVVSAVDCLSDFVDCCLLSQRIIKLNLYIGACLG